MSRNQNGSGEGSNSGKRDRQDKYNDYEAEYKAVKKYLSTRTASATMVAIALNIYRPNLCRYKSELEKAGLLVVLYKGDCKITNYPAQYLTTDPEIIKQVKKGGFNGRV